MRSLLLAAAAVAALMAPASAYAAGRPSPGAAGIGDRLFPKLGNGGYDVQHYDVALSYATAAPSQGIDGTVTINANATQDLSRFDLDFAGDSAGSISVDGRPATFSRSGQDLVITPAQPLPKGRPFVVAVNGFKGHPNRPKGGKIPKKPVIALPNGAAALNPTTRAATLATANRQHR